MTRGSLALVSAVALVAISTTSVVASSAAPSPVVFATNDPAGDYEFKTTASLQDPRINSTATRLPGGRVLVIGGHHVASAEAWDPATGTWTAAGTMAQSREGHTATLLSDGRVLVSGGHSEVEGDGDAPALPDEVWDPQSEAFSPAAGEMLPSAAPMAAVPSALPMELATSADEAHLTLMADGRVLVTGGSRRVDPACGPGVCKVVPNDAAWIWDPASDVVAPVGPMTIGRWGHTATLLDDGRVLLVGSHTHGPEDRTAEIFQPVS